MKNEIITQIYKMHLVRLVGQTGSFRQAAREAGITQSAISQNISGLEKFFDQSLLVRRRGKVSLTPFGKRLVSASEPMFKAMENLANLDKTQADDSISMTLGAYDSIAISVFPSLLPALKRRFPNVEVSIRTARSDQLHAMVRSGDVDLALAIQNSPAAGLRVQPFAEDSLGVFVSNEHEIAKEGVAVMESYGLGTLSPGAQGYSDFMKKFNSLLPKNQTLIKTESFEILRSLALTGTLAAVLPIRVGSRHPRLLRQIDLGEKATKVSKHQLALISSRKFNHQLRSVLFEELEEIFKL